MPSLFGTPFHGHYWTFAPFVFHKLRPKTPPPARHVRTVVEDARRGPVRLTGRLSQAAETRSDGLGGGHDSYYLIQIAHQAAALGWDCMRVNLRGADRSGSDYYHAGSSDDIRAFVRSRAASHYGRVYIVGYSLGGHITLRYVAEGADPNVAGVTAICPPIDLAAGVAEIDQPKGRVYRNNVLNALKDTYRAVARRSQVPLAVEALGNIRTIKQWDELVVAPRHGFSSAEDYYARTTVQPLLHQIAVPTLVVTSAHDPMVFKHTVWPTLAECDRVETVYLERGGHVGFPPDADLGFGDRGPVATQALRWMHRQSS